MNKSIIVLVLAACYAFTAFPRSLEETCDMLLEHSPQVRLAAARAGASRAQAASENNLPDPEIEGEYMWAPAGKEDKWNAGISWSLDWPGTYAARNKLAKAKGNLADAVRMSELISLRTSMLSALVNAHYSGLRCEILRSVVLTNDSIAGYVDEMGKRGLVTLLDRNKVQIEKGRSAASLAAAEAEFDAAVGEISAFVPDVSRETILSALDSLPESLPFSSLSSGEWGAKVDDAPSVEALKLACEVAEREYGVASAESLPAISFGYSHAFEEGNHYNGGHIGLSIPVFSSRGRKESARIAKETARLEMEAEKERLAAEMRGRCNTLESLKSRIMELEGAFDTEEIFRLLMAAWKGGEMSFVDMLSERKYYTEASLELLALRQTYQQTLVALSSLGTGKL